MLTFFLSPLLNFVLSSSRVIVDNRFSIFRRRVTKTQCDTYLIGHRSPSLSQTLVIITSSMLTWPRLHPPKCQHAGQMWVKMELMSSFFMYSVDGGRFKGGFCAFSVLEASSFHRCPTLKRVCWIGLSMSSETNAHVHQWVWKQPWSVKLCTRSTSSHTVKLDDSLQEQPSLTGGRL